MDSLCFRYVVGWSIPMVVKVGRSSWTRKRDFTACGGMRNITGPNTGRFPCGGTRARYVLIERQFEEKVMPLIICHVTVFGKGKYDTSVQG